MAASDVDVDFHQAPDRRGSGSLKWDLHGGDALPFWVADMDFTSPPEVVAALEKRAAHGVFGYAYPTVEEKEAVLHYLRTRHRIHAEGSWLVWLPGLVPALSVTAAVARAQGARSILTCTPIYPPFLKAPLDGDLDVLQVPLMEEAGRLTWDRQALEEAVRPDTGLFILCNPHNPVGRVYTREELDWLGDFCARHELLLCSDEIHCDLILDEERTPHISALHLDHDWQKSIITLMAASKTYNIAGVGCAFAVIPDGKLRVAFRQAMGCWIAPVNVFGYTATAAAFRHGESWRQALLETLRDNHTFFADYLATHHPNLPLTKAEATYLAWLDVRPLGTDLHLVAHLQKHGLTLSNGRDFGAPGFVRWNLGCPHSMLAEGLKRFSHAISALP